MVKKVVLSLLFIDTHAHGYKKSRFGFEIKPDICIYFVPPEGHKNQITNRDISTLDIHIEFKWHRHDNPFVDPGPLDSCKDIAFIHYSDNTRDTLGQISACTAAQLSAQYHTHAFSIYIMHDTAYNLMGQGGSCGNRTNHIQS